MQQGSSWVQFFLVLVLWAPALACADVKVAVLGVGGDTDKALDSVIARIDVANKVSVIAEADIILISRAESLGAACLAQKPVMILDAGLASLDVPASCKVVRVVIAAGVAEQLELLKQLLPGDRRVGVLYSDRSENLLPELRALLSQHKLLLVPELVNQEDSLSAALADLLSEVDVLLALPDVSIYNANNARQLLMTAYRQGKPIIGPDDHWVRAGSLASVYISSDQLMIGLSSVLTALQRGESVVDPVTLDTSTIINGRVADTFGITVPSALEHAVSGERP